jgi:hypothetical protein
MRLQKTSHSGGGEGGARPQRRAHRPAQRPYTHFRQGGLRRFSRAAPLYRLFRVHG